MMQQLELSRILWSAFLHADETHMFYNMSSLLWKVCSILHTIQKTTAAGNSLTHYVVASHSPQVQCSELAEVCLRKLHGR